MKATTELTFEHRKVCVYDAADNKNAPVIYSLDFKESGSSLLEKCEELGCKSFNLVTVSHLHWDAELSPWPADKIISKFDNFTGDADTLLQMLTKKIAPKIETLMNWKPTTRILAGYSMSGLFALYSAFCTDCFSAIVSASGSLWFPNIIEYVKNHAPSPSLRQAYFSIGDLESKTKHPFMKTTETNTQTIAQLLQAKGVETYFELNPGNHFKEQVLREAKGICWAISKLS